MRPYPIALVIALAAVASLASAATSQTAPIVSRIEIRGNKRIPETTIRERISQKTGAALNPAAVNDDIHAIYETGCFQDVIVNRETDRNRTVLVYGVRERPISVRGAAFDRDPSRWLLLAPPVHRPGDGRAYIDEHASYPDWSVLRVFNSFDDCQATQSRALVDAQEGKLTSALTCVIDTDPKPFLQQQTEAECVANDDPRLREPSK